MKMFTSICFLMLLLVISSHNEYMIKNIWFNCFNYIMPFSLILFVGIIHAFVYGTVYLLFNVMLDEIE